MQVLITIGYILLFILCLSVLIVVHELGHFAMAKAFNVYCLDFSIGFGPALFHKKRKNGETYFSIRAFPLGGFVSMYGEGVELPEGVEVPPERSFENIKKWKRIIILFAGVFNNAILAILIFFISEAACVQKSFVYYQSEAASPDISFEVSTDAGSIAEKAGMSGVQWNRLRRVATGDQSLYLASTFVIDKEALLSYEDNSSKTIAAILRTDQLSFTAKSFQNNMHFYELTDKKGENIYDGIDFTKEILATDRTVKSVSLVMNTLVFDKDEQGNVKEGEVTPHNITIGTVLDESAKRVFQDIGVSFFIWERYNSIGEAFGKTFEDFGYSATAIVRSLGALFTSAESWKQVGGIVSIGVQTTSILQNMGIGRFLYVWGLISVNLAIINLLPFPGLDGWQILVLVVEMVAHKEIPERVKNIVSIVGLVLLMAFAALILLKDIIGLF